MNDVPSLLARVDALEAQVAALEREVVTQRVAVVDAAGVERVVLTASAGTGSVLVRLDRPEGRTTGLELVACEPVDEEPIVALVQLAEGNATALRPPPLDRPS